MSLSPGMLHIPAFKSKFKVNNDSTRIVRIKKEDWLTAVLHIDLSLNLMEQTPLEVLLLCAFKKYFIIIKNY